MLSCIWLCDPMDCNLPGSSVHGILQARMPEWVVIPFSRGSSRPRDWTHVSYIDRGILYCWATREDLQSKNYPAPGGSDGKQSACNVKDLSPIPGWEKSPGEGNGDPLQYSYLKNPLVRGAWQATVLRVTESDTTEPLTLSQISMGPGIRFRVWSCYRKAGVLRAPHVEIPWWCAPSRGKADCPKDRWR